MKNELIFELYKGKPTGNKKNFKKDVLKYGKDIDVDNLYIKIINYQIDKYGHQLNYYDPNFFELQKTMGMNQKINKTREYRKGNKDEL